MFSFVLISNLPKTNREGNNLYVSKGLTKVTMYNKILKQAAQKLTSQEVTSQLGKLNGWKVQGETIEKEFQLTNFEETWAFLNQVSMRSHLWGHHPTILTTYNNVKITLTTHDAKGISGIDLKLAKKIDDYSVKYLKTER